jgi:hypothetical protein
MKKRSWIIATGGALLAVLAAIYQLKFSNAPLGQKPLVEMNEAALAGVKAEFNRTAASARFILLLSPT